MRAQSKEESFKDAARATYVDIILLVLLRDDFFCFVCKCSADQCFNGAAVRSRQLARAPQLTTWQQCFLPITAN